MFSILLPTKLEKQKKTTETTLLFSLKEDISNGMGSHGSNMSGASPLEAACGGNSSRSPLLQPCAAAKQGKAEWENQQLPRSSQFSLHSKSHNTQAFTLPPGGCPD